MLLPVVYTARSNHIHRCMQDVASDVEQDLDLPDRLTQDLLRKFPQKAQILQASLQAVKDGAALEADLFASEFKHPQEVIEQWDKPMASLMESCDPSVKALSIQEKHVLLLHVWCAQEGDTSVSFQLQQTLIVVADRQRVMLKTARARYQDLFANIETSLTP